MRSYIGHWLENKKERDHREEKDVGGWTIIKLILERQDGMIWIELACFQDRDQRRALVNTVMNFRVP
jgi:hypothetical protein